MVVEETGKLGICVTAPIV